MGGKNNALGRVDEDRVYGYCTLLGRHRVEVADVNKLRARWRLWGNGIQSLLRLHSRRGFPERQNRKAVMVCCPQRSLSKKRAGSLLRHSEGVTDDP